LRLGSTLFLRTITLSLEVLQPLFDPREGFDCPFRVFICDDADTGVPFCFA